MNMFQFAIASIVDANTGYGLVHTAGGPVNQARGSRGQHPISRLFAGIRTRFAALASASRARARERRDLELLLNMNDHQLDDIGLLRADLYSVLAGVISLGDIERQRRPEKHQGLVELNGLAPGQPVDRALEATNEQLYESRKCA